MSKTFEEVEQHRVFTLCDKVGVAREWVSWKFDMDYRDWLALTLKFDKANYRFLWNSYEPGEIRIKGEALVHPDIYASLA